MWRSQNRKRLPDLGDIIAKLGFPGGLDGKESACNVGDLDSIPGSGRSSREENGYPLQYFSLENSMDCVHGVAKSWTRLSDFHLLSCYTNPYETGNAV